MKCRDHTVSCSMFEVPEYYWFGFDNLNIAMMAIRVYAFAGPLCSGASIVYSIV